MRNQEKVSFSKQAERGFHSLVSQTAQVALGLIFMLVITGGNPPGSMVSAFFVFWIGFVV